MPLDLYTRLKRSMKQNVGQDLAEVSSFLEELPHSLRIELSLYIHEQTYTKLYFLKKKTMSFIAWICPLFKTFAVT